MIDNILKVWYGATPDQVATGRAWYRDAHNLALRIAGNVMVGAGLIASLSPNVSWDRNIVLAERAILDGKPSGTLGMSIRKAQRILDGECPDDVITGSKTFNFYRNILDPSDVRFVTIDRHAHDIAIGERYGERRRYLDNPAKYRLIAADYFDAAKLINVVPSVLQAVTWVAWRESL